MVTNLFIYGLKCPIAGALRYIGKSGDPASRFHAHFSRPVNAYMAVWLDDLREKDLQPLLIVLARVRKPEHGYWVERQFITRYAKLGHPLLNLEAIEGKGIKSPQTFGGKLALLRESKRIRQRELAALLEMDAAYLSRIENDKPNHTPEAATIGRIIKALDLERAEADRLFALAGKVPPDVLKKMLAKPELFERIRRA